MLALAPLVGGLAMALFVFGLSQLELVSHLVCPAGFELIVLETPAPTTKGDLFPELETDRGEEFDFECRSGDATIEAGVVVLLYGLGFGVLMGGAAAVAMMRLNRTRGSTR